MRVTHPFVARVLLSSPVQLAHALAVRRPIALIPRLATTTGSKPNDGTAALLVDGSGEVEACGLPVRVYKQQSMERSDMIFAILAVREWVVVKGLSLVRKIRGHVESHELQAPLPERV